MENLIRLLRGVDFDWTAHLDSVWSDSPFDVPELQGAMRLELVEEIEALKSASTRNSPLGLPLIGPAGSGKTHLLSALRGAVMERSMFFVLIDMTDVGEFWETVLLGYVRSLQRPALDGGTQLAFALRQILRGAPGLDFDFDELNASRPPRLLNHSESLIRALSPRHPAQVREHQDVLRAMILLASDDYDLQDLGYKWLLGIGIEDEDGFNRGFRSSKQPQMSIVQGLSWFLGMAAPTVLALDQLDAIVAEHNLLSAVDDGQDASPRQNSSLGIIQGIAKGLMGLRDSTIRTLTVVSSLEATWNVLDKRVAVSMSDRFLPPRRLKPLAAEETAAQLVERRLRAAYAGAFKPPYATYPYPPSFFVKHQGASPREVLKHCEEHRRSCIRSGLVTEAGHVEPARPPLAEDVEIAQRLQALAQASNVQTALDDDDDRSLDILIETACHALREENAPGDDVDIQIDSDFLGNGRCEPLHARIRLIFRAEGDRERHYAFRFIQSKNAISYQTRLKAALTGSGIDPALPFRRLAILRKGAIPGGKVSAELTKGFLDRGGVLLDPQQNELQLLSALAQLFKTDEAERVRDYLRSSRPVSRLPSFADAAVWLFGEAGGPPTIEPPPSVRAPVSVNNAPTAAVDSPVASPTAAVDSPVASPVASPTAAVDSAIALPVTSLAASTVSSHDHPDQLLVGRRLIAGKPNEAIFVPLDNLTKHVVILASAGSGKTVLVRRLVEEAALLGVPSIVVDGANDLVRLGDTWPETPDSFTDEDRAKAVAYQQRADVVIWTPGRESGNPLNLGLMPDFRAVLENPDELQSAIDMTRSSLEPFVAPGKSAKDQVVRGVLASALRFFAKTGGGDLRSFIDFMSELPDEAVTGFEKGAKLARDAAELLRAAVETNPLLRSRGAELDPSVLLHSDDPQKVRISVLNLSGLPSQLSQQSFVNQLAVTLFSWIKKNPSKGRSLRGLLIIDEARDFVPSGMTVPSKDNLIRLVAQARKYGLGIVFATQAPKSIDHNVIANASTQFYGRANSPTSIEVVQEQLKNRGSTATDIAKLPKGTFYVFSEGMGAPTKIATSLCLSHHPASPPGEEEILQRATRSRSS